AVRSAGDAAGAHQLGRERLLPDAAPGREAPVREQPLDSRELRPGRHLPVAPAPEEGLARPTAPALRARRPEQLPRRAGPVADRGRWRPPAVLLTFLGRAEPGRAGRPVRERAAGRREVRARDGD